MEVFKILNKPEAPAPIVFTVEQAIEIFELHKAGKPAISISRANSYDINRVKTLLLRFAEIRDMMERLVKEEAYNERGVTIETETNDGTITASIQLSEEVTIPGVVKNLSYREKFTEDLEPQSNGFIATYNVAFPRPNSIDELIAYSLYLIGKDHPPASDPIFIADTLDEIVGAVGSIIMNIIAKADIDGAGTFDWWKETLLGQEA